MPAPQQTGPNNASESAIISSCFHTISMRQSMAPTRASHAASHQPPNPAALARLQEKKKEFEAVSALEKASALFVKRIEGLGDDCDIMADAGIG